ncbi:MAG: selenide, water dikinase SelD [Actinomycetota bacterium]|nr:selenide, water dikinase SelD [Actinomycetota bacterium]
MTSTTAVRLTAFSRGAGCACKLGATDLVGMLASLTPGSHPDLLVGHDTGDDAAVWRRPDGRAIVATTDFFAPIVDDPATWGAIAATNAASDVFAMGGRPLLALNVVAWPRDDLELDVLGDVLRGATEAARSGGWVVAGGHTIDGAEPVYGQAVIGEVDADRMLTNAGARAGQSLVLTKPIGTGLVATAAKRSDVDAVAPGGGLHESYRAAITEMTRHNDVAARVALEVGATAATDVTGFGLLGHLHRLALASGVAATLDAEAVPLLPGAVALLDAGHLSGGSRRNLDFVEPVADGGTEVQRQLLADAQTSGGLLFTCRPGEAADAVARLVDAGHRAAVVGSIVTGEPGRVRLS